MHMIPEHDMCIIIAIRPFNNHVLEVLSRPIAYTRGDWVMSVGACPTSTVVQPQNRKQTSEILGLSSQKDD